MKGHILFTIYVLEFKVTDCLQQLFIPTANVNLPQENKDLGQKSKYYIILFSVLACYILDMPLKGHIIRLKTD